MTSAYEDMVRQREAERSYMIAQGYISSGDLDALPRRGVDRVVELDWRPPSGRGPWVVVERGDIWSLHHHSWLSRTALVVSRHASSESAERAAQRMRRKHTRAGRSAWIDVVHGDDVELGSSSAPYGCMSGER